MSGVLGTGLAFPLSVDRRGAIALATGEEDVEQAIRIILGTSPGERPMRPEFGCRVHDYVFDVVDGETLGRMEGEVRSALARWEPRIEVDGIAFDTGQAALGRLEILIAYRVRSTQTVRNLVYPFYIVPAEESA
jgi:uncharacterized protein